MNLNFYSEPPNGRNRTAYLLRLIFFPAVIIVLILLAYYFPGNDSHPAGGTFLYEISRPPLQSQSQYDVNFYHLKLRVDFEDSLKNNSLAGANKIRFSSKTDKLRRIILDFNSPLQVDSVTGLAAGFLHKKGKLIVEFRNELEPGQLGEITVYYHGIPQLYHQWLGGWKYAARIRKADFTPVPLISTINPPFGAQTWLPCKDNPADKADSVLLEIDVPESLTVVCNGALRNVVASTNGRKRFIWFEAYPIATYLLAVNISDFHKAEFIYSSDGMVNFPVQIYGFEDELQRASEVKEQIFRILDFFQEVLGTYPYAPEKLALIHANITGGMENQTAIGVQVIDPRQELLYVHEIAHQWFGDLITHRSFSESFLSEGLATYFTALYIRRYRGEKAFREFMDARRPTACGPMFVKNILIPDSVYQTQRAYYKGAWFFHMLKQTVGEDCFWKGIRSFLKQFAYQSFDSEDLRRHFQDLCQRNLEGFFYSWIHNAGVPELHAKLDSKLSSAGTDDTFGYELRLQQTQRGKPFALFLPVRFRFAEGGSDTTVIVSMERKNQNYRFAFHRKVEQFFLDPENHWLFTLKRAD